MNMLIQSIIGVSLAPITLYTLSTLYEKLSDFSTDVYCAFLGAKDSIKRIKHNI